MLGVHIEDILFDYGNTLVLDPFYSVLKLKANEAIQAIAAEGIEVGRGVLIRKWSEANNETDYPYISHFYQEEEIVQNLLRKICIPPKAALVGKLLHIYRDGFREIVSSDKRNEETKRILLGLKSMSFRLGVLSNERKSFLKICLSHVGIYSALDFALSSEELGVEKPEIKFYQLALAHLHIKPERALYIGDDPLRDIQPARKVGLRTVLYLQPKRYSTPWRDYECQEQVKADFTINKLSELYSLLDGINEC